MLFLILFQICLLLQFHLFESLSQNLMNYFKNIVGATTGPNNYEELKVELKKRDELIERLKLKSKKLAQEKQFMNKSYEQLQKKYEQASKRQSSEDSNIKKHLQFFSSTLQNIPEDILNSIVVSIADKMCQNLDQKLDSMQIRSFMDIDFSYKKTFSEYIHQIYQMTCEQIRSESKINELYKQLEIKLSNKDQEIQEIIDRYENNLKNVEKETSIAISNKMEEFNMVRQQKDIMIQGLTENNGKAFTKIEELQSSLAKMKSNDNSLKIQKQKMQKKLSQALQLNNHLLVKTSQIQFQTKRSAAENELNTIKMEQEKKELKEELGKQMKLVEKLKGNMKEYENKCGQYIQRINGFQISVRESKRRLKGLNLGSIKSQLSQLKTHANGAYISYFNQCKSQMLQLQNKIQQQFIKAFQGLQNQDNTVETSSALQSQSIQTQKQEQQVPSLDYNQQMIIINQGQQELKQAKSAFLQKQKQFQQLNGQNVRLKEQVEGWRVKISGYDGMLLLKDEKIQLLQSELVIKGEETMRKDEELLAKAQQLQNIRSLISTLQQSLSQNLQELSLKHLQIQQYKANIINLMNQLNTTTNSKGLLQDQLNKQRTLINEINEQCMQKQTQLLNRKETSAQRERQITQKMQSLALNQVSLETRMAQLSKEVEELKEQNQSMVKEIEAKEANLAEKSFQCQRLKETLNILKESLNEKGENESSTLIKDLQEHYKAQMASKVNQIHHLQGQITYLQKQAEQINKSLQNGTKLLQQFKNEVSEVNQAKTRLQEESTTNRVTIEELTRRQVLLSGQVNQLKEDLRLKMIQMEQSDRKLQMLGNNEEILKKNHREMQQLLAHQKNKSEEQLKQKESQINELNSRILVSAERLDELKQQNNGLTEQNKALHSDIDKLTSIINSNTHSIQQQTLIEQAIKDQAHQNQQKYVQLLQKHEIVQLQLERMNNKIQNQINLQVDQENSQKTLLKKQIDELRQQLRLKDLQIKDYTDKISENNVHMKTLSQEIQIINGKYELQQKAIKDLQQQISRLLTQIEEQQNKNKQQQRDKEYLMCEKNKLQGQIQRVILVKDQLEKKNIKDEREIRQYEQKMNTMQDEYNMRIVSLQLTLQNQKKHSYKLNKEIEQREAQVKEKIINIAQLNNRLKQEIEIKDQALQDQNFMFEMYKDFQDREAKMTALEEKFNKLQQFSQSFFNILHKDLNNQSINLIKASIDLMNIEIKEKADNLLVIQKDFQLYKQKSLQDINELTKINEHYESKLERLSQDKLNLDEQTEKLKNQFQSTKNDSKTKELQILNMKNKIEQQNQKLKIEIQQYKSKFSKKQSEISKLSENILIQEQQLSSFKAKISEKDTQLISKDKILSEVKLQIQKMKLKNDEENKGKIELKQYYEKEVQKMRTEIERLNIESSNNLKRQMLAKEEMFKQQKNINELKYKEQMRKVKEQLEIIKKQKEISDKKGKEQKELLEKEMNTLKNNLLEQKKVSARVNAKLNQITSELSKLQKMESYQQEIQTKLNMKDDQIKKCFTNINSLKNTIYDLEEAIQTYQSIAEQKEKETEDERSKSMLLEQEILKFRNQVQRLERKVKDNKMEYKIQRDVEEQKKENLKVVENKKQISILPLKLLFIKYFDPGSNYETKVRTFNTLCEVLNLDRKEQELMNQYKRSKLIIQMNHNQKEKKETIQNKLFNFLTSD